MQQSATIVYNSCINYSHDDTMNSITALRKDLQSIASAEKALVLQRFFKTGKGEYGEGDKFIGVVVPEQRKIAKQYLTLDLAALGTLLLSSIHEERLIALLILVMQNQKADQDRQKINFDFYLAHTARINNWDLVDLSAPHIVGKYLLDKNKKPLQKLVISSSLWERRIAIVATQYFIRSNYFDVTLELAKKLLQDKEDLLHKATGWMLREVGKRDMGLLEQFLKQYYKLMPRTMLRYAIEKFSEDKRQMYLQNRTVRK